MGVAGRRRVGGRRLDAMNDQGLQGLTVQTLKADDGTRLRIEAEPVDIDKAEEVTTRWPS